MSSSSDNDTANSGSGFGFSSFQSTSNPFSSTTSPFMRSSTIFGSNLFQSASNGQTPSQITGNIETSGTSTAVSTGPTPTANTSTSATSTSSSSSGGGGFVFGQNLSARAMNLNQASSSNGDRQSEPTPSSFQASAQQNSNHQVIEQVFGSQASSIVAQPPPESSTGEEEERNVVHMNCKLYVYDASSSSWVERGQGQLRLNDSIEGPRRSRIIFRVMGTLRLALNTQLWEGIDLKRLGGNKGKCLRFLGRDAQDEGKLHIFMVKSPSEDQITNLYRAIQLRIPHSPRPTVQADEGTKGVKRRINEEEEDDSDKEEDSEDEEDPSEEPDSDSESFPVPKREDVKVVTLNEEDREGGNEGGSADAENFSEQDSAESDSESSILLLPPSQVAPNVVVVKEDCKEDQVADNVGEPQIDKNPSIHVDVVGDSKKTTPPPAKKPHLG